MVSCQPSAWSRNASVTLSMPPETTATACRDWDVGAAIPPPPRSLREAIKRHKHPVGDEPLQASYRSNHRRPISVWAGRLRPLGRRRRLEVGDVPVRVCCSAGSSGRCLAGVDGGALAEQVVPDRSGGFGPQAVWMTIGSGHTLRRWAGWWTARFPTRLVAGCQAPFVVVVGMG